MDTPLARVLTLNLWNLSGPWRERRDEIVAWLDLLDPDLVAFQEVVENADGRNQAEYLAARAAREFHVAFAGVPWRDRRFGNAVLSRWPIDSTAVADLPPSSLPGDIERVALHVRSHGLDFFCTHLSWRMDDGAIREAQVRALMDFVRARADPAGVPPILAGDMNADPESNEIRYLCGLAALGGDSAYFQDAWGLAGGGGPGWTWDNRNPLAVAAREPDRRIDYIFLGWRPGPRAWIRRAEVVADRALTGVQASDHYGLLAELAKAPDEAEP
ncbi:MAG: endonuclease/exonuclease/phosphatase family protein [Acidimicrobiales bacterium]